jgi:hypothetical protein
VIKKPQEANLSETDIQIINNSFKILLLGLTDEDTRNLLRVFFLNSVWIKKLLRIKFVYLFYEYSGGKNKISPICIEYQ